MQQASTYPLWLPSLLSRKLLLSTKLFFFLVDMASSSQSGTQSGGSEVRRVREHLQNFLNTTSSERSIEFTPLGVPTGPNMQIFQEHLTYVARMHLSCNCENWGKVVVAVKDKMWEDVKVYHLYNYYKL